MRIKIELRNIVVISSGPFLLSKIQSSTPKVLNNNTFYVVRVNFLHTYEANLPKLKRNKTLMVYTYWYYSFWICENKNVLVFAPHHHPQKKNVARFVYFRNTLRLVCVHARSILDRGKLLFPQTPLLLQLLLSLQPKSIAWENLISD